MTPDEILPSLVELSIAIAGFSGVVVAIQERITSDPQVRIYLSSLLLSTFVACALSVGAMVLLASPLAATTAWSLTSLAHAMAAGGILIVRSAQRRRGGFVRTRPLLAARGVLFALAAIQLANAVLIREAWLSAFGLGVYSLFGFGFFVALLFELEGRSSNVDPPTRARHPDPS